MCGRSSPSGKEVEEVLKTVRDGRVTRLPGCTIRRRAPREHFLQGVLDMRACRGPELSSVDIVLFHPCGDIRDSQDVLQHSAHSRSGDSGPARAQ
jgi:hypothetical protein